MDADLQHIDDICADVKRQYDEGITNCALFFTKLVPEGVPAIDKASIFAKNYIPFRDKLKEMGIECGILVQCSLGHGYALDAMFGFTSYKRLTDGVAETVVCPYDEGAREYFRAQFATLAALKPKVLMLDDDFCLMYRGGKGCACELHLDAVERRYGKRLTQSELFGILKDRNATDNARLTDMYLDTQRESLVDMARAMRAGIDSVDPTIRGVVCGVSHTTEFIGEVARIFAGEGHEPTVRINCNNYHPSGARYIAYPAYKLSLQKDVLRREGITTILAETDTCPHNRYSTSAQSLHSHFTSSIIEGASGAKHWITRLSSYEPASGNAYRKKLGQYAGCYNTLSELIPSVKRFGCRIPIPTTKDYGFTLPGWYSPREAWSDCVLERLGVPMYYSSEPGGATFLDGDTYIFNDGEITDMLRGTLFISSNSARELCARGFSEHLGVTVRDWNGLPPSFERVVENNSKCVNQVGLLELVPSSAATVADSIQYHLHDGKDEIPIFPSVTVYNNALGGRVICFAGTPKAQFVYYEAFSMLCETRKGEIARLLRESGNLPIMYKGDEEVYLLSGDTEGGELFAALFNIGLDPIDEIKLFTERKVTEVRALLPSGEWEVADVTPCDDGVIIHRPLLTLEPAILLIK